MIAIQKACIGICPTQLGCAPAKGRPTSTCQTELVSAPRSA